MISQFWSLCRACPALDVDKLHSEYRSTYRWHEFTPKQQDVIKKPPQPMKDDITFPRKKKHFDVAYRSQGIFDSDLRPIISAVDGSSDQERQTRSTKRSNKMSSHIGSDINRRARSEGPVNRNPLLSTATPKNNSKNYEKPESSYPPPAPSSKWNSKESSSQKQKAMKESLSMGQILSPKNEGPSAGREDASKANGDTKSDVVPRRSREYRSEYRQCFRPFSHYEYLDGRFVHSPGTSTPPSDSEDHSRKNHRQAALHGEPWYQEVVELRKQAMDYKCRGWGTDVNNNSKRAEIYEQTCKRESLSALSLAIITPRATEPIKKEPIKSSTSPTKRLSRPRTAPPARGSGKSSRSESAHPASDTAAVPHSVKSAGDQADSKIQGKFHGNRSKSVGPSRPKISQKPLTSSSIPADSAKVHKEQPKRLRPTTLNTNSCNKQVPSKPSESSVRKEEPPVRGAILKQDIKEDNMTSSGVSPSRKIQVELDKPKSGGRPGDDVITSRAIGDSVRRPLSRSSSKASRDTSRPPSAIENNLDYFREPVVKSPPEPTRVKSPEQMVRSPDPINWTVPLDTAKTFSVTQSVREGDSARQSPMSDHSSHFDSVSGTAINLGMMSRNERGVAPVHPPKISSLAKEARDPTPGFTKDSTMTRPSGGSAAPPRPLKEPLQPVSATNGSSLVKKEEDDEADDGSAIGSTNPTNVPVSDNDLSQLNGASKEEGDNNPPIPSATAKPLQSGLKCLDDPNFTFESEPKQTQQPKKPSYRVLEDPFETELIPSATPPVIKATAAPGAPYKVLEDPMSTSMYDSGKRPIVPATEVLEGARERFDKFWAKPGDK